MYERKKTYNKPNRPKDYIQSKRKTSLLPPIDKGLLTTVIFLTIFGIMAVFSAGAPEGLKFYNNLFHYGLKHIVFVVIGLGLLWICSVIDYRKWKEWSLPIAGVVVFLILATKIPGLGRTAYGSSRWLTFLPIQPSEFGKLVCVILCASALSEAKTLLDKNVLRNFGIIAIMMLIIIAQPNLSIFLLLGITSFAIMLNAGVNPGLIISTICLGIPLVIYKILNTPYQLNRIKGWLDPLGDPQGTGYNLIQSWYAIASGGLFGVGFGQSKQKLFWLPFGHTDFIFSVISEEFGFLGSLILIGLFLSLVIKGFKLSKNSPDSFARLLAFGITFIIGVQAFINMGVAIGLLPVTGVTLPLISYGGTSVMVTMIMLGILLNISRSKVKRTNPNAKRARTTRPI